MTSVMDDLAVGLPKRTPFLWNMVAESLKRPYRVTVSMVVFVALVPVYLFIPQLVSGRTVHVPALALDHRIPQQPAWVLVYGSLYLFLILLPVFVVRQEALIRRTVYAYLTIWLTAYVCFYVYPTAAPRAGDIVPGEGFLVWALRFLYSSDPPYNCLPSLHVAHSLVSALASGRVHRGLGVVASACAFVVGISTLFTRQHYILDVVTGIVLACVAYAIFLRGTRRDDIPELDRRVAPALALVVIALVAAGIGCYWLLYRLGVGV
ncbi:MAG: phosphatase PAP2 family protein [Thermoanaerobaculia bacterium]|nr:phosphatase PAP2 family protein [Thermoanaerobaculia bacterium]